MKKFFSRSFKWILKLWVRTNVLPKNLASIGVNRELPIIYALSDQSYADLLVLDLIAEKNNLPSAFKAFKIGKKTKIDPHFASRRNQASEEKKYRPKNLMRLVEALNQGDIDEFQVVPVYLRWGRAPDREDSWFRALFNDAWVNPTVLRKFFIILIHGKQTFANFSQPITVTRETLSEVDKEEATKKIIRLARIHFYQQRVAMIGPDLSHRRTLLNQLLKRPRVLKAITERAAQKDQQLTLAREKAMSYAQEIASDYNYSTIRFYDLILTRVWNQIYNGVDVHISEQVKSLAGSHEIIYVPCHRSHIDYLLLSYVLYYNALATPYIAAGINLNMPLIGPILRRGGAFFLRRSFKGNPLYATIFAEYLTMMIEKGYPIEYFIEGGRSRTGRLLPPKPGMLGMTLQAAANSERPIAFVPVYFGYEKVMEIGSYIGELYGKQKRKETLGGTLATLGRLKENFGKVHARFGEPLLLNNFMGAVDRQWKQRVQANDREWSGPVLENLGSKILTRINETADVNSVNLLALAMLASNNQTVDRQQLASELSVMKTLMENCGYPRVTITPFSPQEIIQNGIDLKAISEQKHILGDLIQVEQAQALTLTYFRNNSLHLIALPSLLACVFRHNRNITAEQAKKLCHWVYPYLKAELFIPWDLAELDKQLDQQIELMSGLGLIQYEGDKIHPAEAHTLEFEQLAHVGALVLESIQRYYLIITLLAHQGSGVLYEAELESLAQMAAQRLTILHSINAPDFYDKTVIRSFLNTLKAQGFLTYDERGKICFDLSIRAISREAYRLMGRSKVRQIARLNSAENDKLLQYAREQMEEKETSRLKKLKRSGDKNSA
ncbi:MAG: glycerol-3-phosphate 1-O-acyltransferase PlsB [Pseudomonadota bacterium]|nr:glycerol-3-phosphate 1-O-acyltransferase PlsB [Pseudomonadota bacterium]